MAATQFRDVGCEKVTIFSDAIRGRGVRATTFIEPETTLMIDIPYVTAIEEEFRRLRCSFCYKKREKLKACGGCNFVYYCDNQCQSSNYSNHQYECKYLKSADCDVSVRTRNLLVAVQKHLKPVKKRSKKTITHDAQGFPVIPEELYNKKKANCPKEKTTSEPDMDHLWDFVRQKSLPVTEDLVEWFQGILDANMFSIYDEAWSTIIGEGLYIRLAMMNHSCRPNCAFTSNGREMRIASIRPISPGEECVISYMNLMAPTHIRQSKLKKWYDFDCDCKRCTQDFEKVVAT